MLLRHLATVAGIAPRPEQSIRTRQIESRRSTRTPGPLSILRGCAGTARLVRATLGCPLRIVSRMRRSAQRLGLVIAFVITVSMSMSPEHAEAALYLIFDPPTAPPASR